MPIKKIIAELNKIRVDEKRGQCFSVTLESAKVLTEGKQAIEINEDNAIFSTKEGFKQLTNEKTKADGDKILEKGEHFLKGKGGSGKKAFFDRLEAAEPKTVFMIETCEEDHYYNIVKLQNNKLYLLDSDAHIYKELKNQDDLKIEDGSKVNEDIDGEFDYFHSSNNNEISLVLYEVGKLHEKWLPKKLMHTLFEDKNLVNQANPRDQAQLDQENTKKLGS